MSVERMPFRVTALHASVPEGIPIPWMGKELPSGPLLIELQEDSKSVGELSYTRRRSQLEFHVRVDMPELVELLQDLGVDPELTKPVYAVVQSEGTILADHSFNLVGACRIEPHVLFDGAQAAMLPGH